MPPSDSLTFSGSVPFGPQSTHHFHNHQRKRNQQIEGGFATAFDCVQLQLGYKTRGKK